MSSKPGIQRKPITLSQKADILAEVRVGKLLKTKIAHKVVIAKKYTARHCDRWGTGYGHFGKLVPKWKRMQTVEHNGMEGVPFAWIERARRP